MEIRGLSYKACKCISGWLVYITKKGRENNRSSSEFRYESDVCKKGSECGIALDPWNTSSWLRCLLCVQCTSHKNVDDDVPGQGWSHILSSGKERRPPRSQNATMFPQKRKKSLQQQLVTDEGVLFEKRRNRVKRYTHCNKYFESYSFSRNFSHLSNWHAEIGPKP